MQYNLQYFLHFDMRLVAITWCNVMCDNLLKCKMQLFSVVQLLGQDLNGHLVQVEAQEAR